MVAFTIPCLVKKNFFFYWSIVDWQYCVSFRCKAKWISFTGFPRGAVVKNLPANAGDTGDTGSIPRSRRSPGVGNGNTLQYSCLENFMDRGVCQATVHAIPTESDTTEHTCTHSFLRCFIHIGRYRVLRKVPCAIHVCTLNHFSCVQLSAVLRTVSLSSVHGIF